MNTTPTQPPQGVMAELRDLLARAKRPELPWSVNENAVMSGYGEVACCHYYADWIDGRRNAALIVAAVNALPGLLDEVDALREKNRVLTERIELHHDRATAAESRASALLARCEGLEACRLFARDALDSDRRYSIDGADVESLAQKHGLLAEREVTESCGEDCICADYGFPQKCLRFTDILAATRTTGD